MVEVQVVVLLVVFTVILAGCSCRIHQAAVARTAPDRSTSTTSEQCRSGRHSLQPAISIELTEIVTASAAEGPTGADSTEERYPPTPSLAPPVYSPS
ncbi:hypothetical protein DFJ73DRAFT_783075 [Zopfochytrium polystomum]|nr:hypothetical protein DFJ73DRAFT_783075 [Zopfochytrium polystomum]